ncbi:MAG: hypothetical protein ACRD0R_04525 [Acidimicrobiales bacterium]|jgi:hypothetical protein
MRFKLGVALGFAAGYWVGSTPTDERRAKLEELWTGVRENPRVQRVTDTVSQDARRLGDAVEQRLVDTADGAVGVIARDKSSGGSSATPSTGTDNGPTGKHAARAPRTNTA